MNCEVCVASVGLETQTGSCAGLPANAIPNVATTITQYNNGGTRFPNTTYTYSTTPSTASCLFICATNYNRNGSACVPATQPATCTGLPANAIANTPTTITQTWNGSAWAPSATAIYSATSLANTCTFSCPSNYNRDGSTCVAATQTVSCV